MLDVEHDMIWISQFCSARRKGGARGGGGGGGGGTRFILGGKES